jgi:hypothetical protein
MRYAHSPSFARNVLLRLFFLVQCFGTFDDAQYQDTGLDQEWRLWLFQVCTQWGYFTVCILTLLSFLLVSHNFVLTDFGFAFVALARRPLHRTLSIRGLYRNSLRWGMSQRFASRCVPFLLCINLISLPSFLELLVLLQSQILIVFFLLASQAYLPGKHFTVPHLPNVTQVNELGDFDLAADRLAFIDGESKCTPFFYSIINC